MFTSLSDAHVFENASRNLCRKLKNDTTHDTSFVGSMLKTADKAWIFTSTKTGNREVLEAFMDGGNFIARLYRRQAGGIHVEDRNKNFVQFLTTELGISDNDIADRLPDRLVLPPVTVMTNTPLAEVFAPFARVYKRALFLFELLGSNAFTIEDVPRRDLGQPYPPRAAGIPQKQWTNADIEEARRLVDAKKVMYRQISFSPNADDTKTVKHIRLDAKYKVQGEISGYYFSITPEYHAMLDVLRESGFFKEFRHHDIDYLKRRNLSVANVPVDEWSPTQRDLSESLCDLCEYGTFAHEGDHVVDDDDVDDDDNDDDNDDDSDDDSDNDVEFTRPTKARRNVG